MPTAPISRVSATVCPPQVRHRSQKAFHIRVLRSSAALVVALCGGFLPLLIETARCADSATFHVSPTGDDTWEGSASRPFATLERARGAVRERKAALAPIPAGGLVVELAPGTHRRTTTFTLSSEDSGTEATPVLWRARTPGATLIDAGVRLPNSGLQLVEGVNAERLVPEARGNVYMVDLKAMGLHNIGPYPLNFDNGGGLCELFFDGQRQPLSRWPNAEPARIERIVDKGESAPGEPKRVGRFVAREDRVARWPVEQGVWLEGYWRVPWDARTVRVAAIDAQTREVTLAAPVAGGIGSKYAGPAGSGREPWWGVNIVEEIDQPGEWAADFTKGLLRGSASSTTLARLTMADSTCGLLWSLTSTEASTLPPMLSAHFTK